MFSNNLSSWPPAGTPGMKDLHQICLDALSDLSETDDDDFSNGFEVLLKKMEYAFATEQQWMEEIDYPALPSHTEQHARLLAALHHVQASVMEGDIALGRRVVDDLLPQWLSVHMDIMDAALEIVLRLETLRLHSAPGHRFEYA